MDTNKSVVILISSYDNEFVNVYFNENDKIIIDLKQKLIKFKKKTYEKMLCEYENIKLYINPLNGDIHDIIKESQYNHVIDDKLKYISYESRESKINTEDIMILNNYPNQEIYIINEYIIDVNTIIVFLKNKNNNLIKIYGKTTNNVDVLRTLLAL